MSQHTWAHMRSIVKETQGFACQSKLILHQHNNKLMNCQLPFIGNMQPCIFLLLELLLNHRIFCSLFHVCTQLSWNTEWKTQCFFVRVHQTFRTTFTQMSQHLWHRNISAYTRVLELNDTSGKVHQSNQIPSVSLSVKRQFIIKSKLISTETLIIILILTRSIHW